MSQQPTLMAAAVQNPMFQSAVKQAAFQSVSQDENQSTNLPDANVIAGASPEEMAAMEKWGKILKYWMMFTATFMMITSWYNIASSSSSVATGFIALYLLFFSTLICCYEVALKQFSLLIVQNFGFLYNIWGRSIFIIFVAILAFQLSSMGIACFVFLLVYWIVQMYVCFKYPKFDAYLLKLHYFEGARPSGSVSQV